MVYCSFALLGQVDMSFRMAQRIFVRSAAATRNYASRPNLNMPVRNDWTKEEIGAIYNQPLLELMYQAATVHRQYWDASEVDRFAYFLPY